MRGGSNIAPVEVEAALREQPQVPDAVVVGIPDPVLGQRVAALVIPGTPEVLDVQHLRRGLAAVLAEYEVPETFAIVDDIPRIGGKIDRAAAAEEVRRRRAHPDRAES